MPNITIPANEMGELLSVQIMSALSEETKSNLIQAALGHLLRQPDGGRYGEKLDSPLQTAFNGAMNQVASQLAKEFMEQEEILSKVRATFMELAENLPDIKDDWQLQNKVWQAVLERAKEIKEENRGY